MQRRLISSGILASIIFITASQAFAQGQAEGQWDPLLGKYDQREYVYTIQVNGTSILFGGDFEHQNTTPGLKGLGQFNRSGQITSLDGGVTGPGFQVRSILVTEHGIYVAGLFNVVRDMLARNIAKWNGLNFEPVGQGVNGNVYSLAVDGDNIYVGGEFTQLYGSDLFFNNIARWNGMMWERLGTGLNGPVYALAVYGHDVYVGGKFLFEAGKIKIIDLLNGVRFSVDEAIAIRGTVPLPYNVNWCDYDNDGDLDLFIMNSHHGDNYMYENMGDGSLQIVLNNQFTEVDEGSAGIAWYDYDRDGDQDMVMIGDEYSGDRLYMLENTTDTNHWLNLRLVGIQSNRDALGAKIHVKAIIDGELTIQTREVNNSTWLTQSSLEQAIGLGDAATASLVMIEWPSGIWQIMTDVTADQFITVIEDTSNGLPKMANLSARQALELHLLDDKIEQTKILSAMPSDLSMSPCFPNPFNPATEIQYSLPRESQVIIRILNARGEEVRILFQQKQYAGHYTISWNGTDNNGNEVSSGLYLCRLGTNGFVGTQKMLLVR